MALWLSRMRVWWSRSLVLLVACVLAATSPSRARAQWSQPRIEIAGGLGRSGLAVPPQHPLMKYGPTAVAAVHVALNPYTYVGVDATGWRIAETGEKSQTIFVLASARIYFPRAEGISLMLGAGVAQGTYGRFQFPDLNDSPHVHRFAIGFGAGYEIPSSGPLSIGIFGRTMNTLGSWKQSNLGFKPTIRRGNSVLTTAGISIAWRSRKGERTKQP